MPFHPAQRSHALHARAVGPAFRHDPGSTGAARSGAAWVGPRGCSSARGSAAPVTQAGSAAKTYEMLPHQVDAMPPELKALVRAAAETIPELKPIFTCIKCGRDESRQRVTFQHRAPLSLWRSVPCSTASAWAMGESVMQIIGLCLGIRPAALVVLALGRARVQTGGLGMIPVLPRIIRAPPARAGRAPAPNPTDWNAGCARSRLKGWPGQFSVLSLRVTPQTQARVSLYLRPIEFEIPAAPHRRRPQARTA